MSTNISENLEFNKEVIAEEVRQESGGMLVCLTKEITQFEMLKRMYELRFWGKKKMTPAAKLVLYALMCHYNPDRPYMFPSQRYMSDHLDISEKSVERGVKELVELGYLTYKTVKVNRYKFTKLFFDSVKMTEPTRQNVGYGFRQIVGQTNKRNKENNKEEVFKNNFSVDGGAEDKAACGASVQQRGNGNGVPRLEEVKDSRNRETACEKSLTERSGNAPIVRSDGRNTTSGASQGFSQNRAYRPANAQGADNNRFGAYTNRGSGRGYTPAANSAWGNTAINRSVPTVAETNDYLKNSREDRKNACSPLDYTREEAVKWLESLPPMLHKSAFARKLYEKYDLAEMFEQA